MDDFTTTYFGYASFEEYRRKRLAALDNASYAKERAQVPMTKEEHEVAILSDIERHCGIVISDFNFSKGKVGLTWRNWRHEHPVVYPRLPAEVQEWIRTKTIPLKPIYG